jgi:glycosyltransferase involved in cell wall biosynthesis
VLFVGRLTRLKGVPYLIDAFSKAKLPNAELLLLGDTAFVDPSWLAAPGIRHQPPIPRYLLPSVFRSADVFVMPSLAESYGLVLLEAMASGIPVVASANSIGPDVVDDGVNGYVVPARDSDALAERIVMLARDPSLRHKMSEAAVLGAERFTWSAYEANLIAALGR